MNKNSEQKNDGTELWQEQPYVSRFTPETLKELAEPDLKARVATKSFATVFVGLLISTIASYLAFPYFDTLYAVFPIFFGAQFLFMLINGWVIGRDNLVFAGIVYLAFSVNNGITFCLVFQMFGLNVITEAFLMSAVVFGVMTAIGYFTKKDLSTVGGVYGTVAVGGVLVTLFNFLVFHRSGFPMFMNYVIVLLFVGIIAYNMTGWRKMVLEGGEENADRIALFMGMQLYVNFMNVFVWVINILSKLLGDSKKK